MTQPPLDDPVTALGLLLQAEVGRRADASLGLPEPMLAPDDALLALLASARAPLATWLAGALADPGEGEPQWHRRPDLWLRAELVRWLRRRNQFIELDADAIAELGALCRDGLLALVSVLGSDAPVGPALRPVLRRQRATLAGFVRVRLGAEPREVVSSEYTPELQLALLGLDEPGLQTPVLDIGCGMKAALVRKLRARGVATQGIDRDADPQTATVADWLRYDYGVDRWGTIVSHLGFSLHLLHHHLAGRPAAFVYAELYMQILRSLRPGGVFAYAPGLPFLERLLPRTTYQCTQTTAPQGPGLRAAAADTGLLLGHATQVRRLA